MPRGDGGRTHKGYAFCEYPSVESATYARTLFANSVMLYGRAVKFNYSPQGRSLLSQHLARPLEASDPSVAMPRHVAPSMINAKQTSESG